jgi:hypothetical protein
MVVRTTTSFNTTASLSDVSTDVVALEQCTISTKPTAICRTMDYQSLLDFTQKVNNNNNKQNKVVNALKILLSHSKYIIFAFIHNIK